MGDRMSEYWAWPEYSQGYNARKAGRPNDDNPYDPRFGGGEFWAWEDGYAAAAGWPVWCPAAEPKLDVKL